VGSWVAPSVSTRVGPPSPQLPISEAALLARALGRLRRDHDPLWALGDLDEHDRQYPRGELRRETALARAEALLALDRNSEALDVLDSLKLEPSELDRRALLARAELRAHEGRRAEAIADFDRVLQGVVDANTAIDPASHAWQIAERALYGRAVCRLRGGDLGGARVDLRAYLERFPRGPHGGDVEKTLGRLGS
jgi:tetratricopeptide (TPR) repeat protein